MLFAVGLPVPAPTLVTCLLRRAVKRPSAVPKENVEAVSNQENQAAVSTVRTCSCPSCR